MKKLKLIIPILVVILIGVVVFVIGLNKGNEDLNDGKEVEKLTTVILSINPKLALEVDKNNNIKNMYPLNSDAESFDRESYIGLSLEQSINKVVKDAEKYLKKNNKITISVVGNNDTAQETVQDIVKEVETVIKEKGIETEKKEIETTELKEIEEKIEEIKKEEETVKNESNKEENKENDKEEITDKENNKEETTEKEEDKEDVKQDVVDTPKSGNNNLNSLVVDGISIKFDKKTTSYSAVVGYSTSKVKVSASAEDSKAKISGTGSKNISVGKNSIKVSVTAEDGSVKTYVVNIERRAQINLNDQKEYLLVTASMSEMYVYPNNEVCKNVFPDDVDVPEGMTYDEYCQNNLPNKYPEFNGPGYKCKASEKETLFPGATMGGVYMCEYIDGIADIASVKKSIEKIVKVGNYYSLGGGFGGGEPITLDEAICSEYKLTCGRW